MDKEQTYKAWLITEKAAVLFPSKETRARAHLAWLEMHKATRGYYPCPHHFGPCAYAELLHERWKKRDQQ